jgi:tripartite ATP-independent transporter DctM subunit
MHPLTVLLVSLTVLLVVGVPISFSLILSSLLVIWMADLPTVVAVQQMFTGINNFTLLALPFFFLAGNVMTDGGISERLVKLAMAMVGHLRGGLAHVNVVVGMFISGISGSSTADAAAISSIFCPAMKKRGYDERFAVCLSACTSTMGAVIPPSILMVVYGATAGVSIGALLIGGILPGVLMGLALMVQSHIFAVKYNFPREHPHFLGVGAIWDGLKAAAWPLGVPIIVVAGMIGGVFTPTESASVAAVYSLFVTLVVFKSLTWARAAQDVRGDRRPVLAGAVLPRRRDDLRLDPCLLPGAGHGDEFHHQLLARSGRDHDPDRHHQRAARHVHGRAPGDPDLRADHPPAGARRRNQSDSPWASSS